MTQNEDNSINSENTVLARASKGHPVKVKL